MAKEIIQGKLKLKLIVEYYFPKGCADNLGPYLSSQKSIFSRSKIQRRLFCREL